MPVGDSMREFWDERARENAAWFVDTSLDYDEPDLDEFLRTGERVVDQALVQAPARPAQHGVALEIGSGLGRICRALAPHFERVIGLDVSAAMVEQAGGLVDRPDVEFRVSDGESLTGIEDASVDFVVSFTVFQHLVSRRLVVAYLREAARVLRPGGVLAVQWNNLPSLRYRLTTARLRLQRALGLDKNHRSRDAPEFRGTTAPVALVRSTLEEAGLTIEGLEGEGTLFAWVWAQRPATAAD